MNQCRWISVVGRMASATVVAAVLVWPLLATALQASRGDRWASTSSGLIDAAAFREEAGIISGPAVQTLRVVGGAVLGALVMGGPLALGLFRTDLPGRRLLRYSMALAVFVPMPLYAAGWLGGFGNSGYQQAFGMEPILSGWAGAAFVHAAAGVPWITLLVGVGLRRVEPELEESALLDLTAWRVAGRVTLWRSLGAIAGAALLVAALTGGEMTVTDLLRVRTYAEESYVQYGMGRPPWSVALVAIPPTAVLIVAFLVLVRAVRVSGAGQIVAPQRPPRIWRLGGWRWPAGVVAWCSVILLLGPPVAAMVWRAGRIGGDAGLGMAPGWSVGGVRDSVVYAWSEVREPLLRTASIASIGALASVAIAWMLAWQSRRAGPWRGLVIGSAAVMLALPGPVAGMALKIAYLHVPIVYDSIAILILGYVLKTMPFALLVLWPAVRTVPESLIESAEVDGLGPLGRVVRVGLPMTLGASGASGLVCFVLAMGELPITNLVTPAGMDSLTVFLWGQMHFGVDSRITAVGLVLLGVYATVGALAVAAISRAFPVGGR